MRPTPVPSDRALTALVVSASLAAGLFLLWLVTVAAAGTGSSLPDIRLVTPDAAGGGHNPLVLAWRLLNAALATAAAFALWMRWFDCRHPRDPFLKAGELVLVMAAVVGAVHMVVMRGPLTLATPFVSLSSALTLLGLVRTGRPR